MLLSHVKLKTARLSPGSVIHLRAFQTLALSAFLLYRALKRRKRLTNGQAKSYYYWKRAVNAESGSLKKFCVALTRQYFESEASSTLSSKRSSNESSSSLPSPRAKRATEAYASEQADSRRLNRSLNHPPAIAPETVLKTPRRCALCAANHYLEIPNGKMKTLPREGPRMRDKRSARAPEAFLCVKPLTPNGASCFAKWRNLRKLRFPSAVRKKHNHKTGS